MQTFKSTFLLIGQLALVFVAMLIAFIVSSSLINTGIQMSAEETSQGGVALLVVSFVNAMLLAYLIRRSRWHGVKLIGAVIVVSFGIDTFMSQIETLYFNSAIQMSSSLLGAVVAIGFIRAVIFAPLAVLILGKWRGTDEAVPARTLTMSDWLIRFAVLAIVYMLVYFVFGYYVAWQFADVRQYYTGSTNIQPVLTHFGAMLSANSSLPLFQIFRGVLWAALALLIVRMSKAGRWELCVAIALTMAILISSGLLFPNPVMPAAVRFAHAIELVTSMLTFGAIAGWVWTYPVAQKKQVIRHNKPVPSV